MLHRRQPYHRAQQQRYAAHRIPHVPHTLVLEDEELADQHAGQHDQHQHHPVGLVAIGHAVVVRQHGEQHRQREVGVVHAALLAALAMDRVRLLAGLERGHHLALPRDDPEEHVGAHDGRDHRADQQKRRAAREQMARRIRRDHHVECHQHAHQPVAPAEHAADGVVHQPTDRQERQRQQHRRRRCHVEHAAVDQVNIGVEQVHHRQQRKAGHPRGVRLPVEPVQVFGQLLRCQQVFLRVVEPAAVHGPQLAVHALFQQVRRGGPGQAVVEPDEVER